MRMQTRTALLKAAIHKWLDMPKVFKQSIAIDVVAKLDESGMTKILDIYGIHFSKSDDIHNDALRNYEKLFRWLGELDIAEQPGKLWHIEQAIVAAMPHEIRIAYLQDCYTTAKVQISPCCKTRPEQVDLSTVLQHLIKEDSESQIAIIELNQRATRHNLLKCKKELRESIGIKTAALEAVNKLIEQTGIVTDQHTHTNRRIDKLKVV